MRRASPLYLDLPHHFCTLELAEIYRQALASHGRLIPAAEFESGYQTAARYIGLRYLWWAAEAWLRGELKAEWVRFYINLIV